MDAGGVATTSCTISSPTLQRHGVDASKTALVLISDQLGPHLASALSSLLSADLNQVAQCPDCTILASATNLASADNSSVRPPMDAHQG